MNSTVSELVELVEVVEARLIGENDQVLVIVCGSTFNIAKAYARENNKARILGARGMEISADPVPRFRVPVLDTQYRPMYFAGATRAAARVQAAIWTARQLATVH